MLSLLIPVFNEQEAIAQTIERAHKALGKSGGAFEIIVINDGSTDGTAAILQSFADSKIKIISRTSNTGYGASIKTGIRKSKGELIATIDADGTYPIEDLPLLVSKLKECSCDMAVGSRTKPGAQFSFPRKFGKLIVGFFANYVVEMKIPDNNSGMRVFTRELAENYMHLYPQRFSFTLTITLAALTNGYSVEFVPIDYFKRIGKSSLSSGLNGIKNFLGFLNLIVRITTYFRPLRFFVWPSFILMIAGMTTIISTILKNSNISDAGLLLFLAGLQIGLFGMLAEVVVRNRITH